VNFIYKPVTHRLMVSLQKWNFHSKQSTFDFCWGSDWSSHW